MRETEDLYDQKDAYWEMISTHSIRIRGLRQRQFHILDEKKDAGVDLNIKNLATVSDGKVFENSRLLERSLMSIERTQRKMSRHEKGSAKWLKYNRQLAYIYERLNNRRNDEAHKISSELADSSGIPESTSW